MSLNAALIGLISTHRQPPALGLIAPSRTPSLPLMGRGATPGLDPGAQACLREGGVCPPLAGRDASSSPRSAGPLQADPAAIDIAAAAAVETAALIAGDGPDRGRAAEGTGILPRRAEGLSHAVPDLPAQGLQRGAGRRRRSQAGFAEITDGYDHRLCSGRSGGPRPGAACGLRRRAGGARQAPGQPLSNRTEGKGGRKKTTGARQGQDHARR
jgi:hypothetical protein